jgi:hypothetical protein
MRREHRCSSSCVPECSAIKKPKASESLESGVTSWRCWQRCAAARAAGPVDQRPTCQRHGGGFAELADPEEEKRELERFLQGLQALWRQSRPLQKKPKPRQGRRSRVDPFQAHADLIPQWLEAEADVGSQELLDRLIALDRGRYRPQHKRTLQRRIRDWRVARVQACLESAAIRLETTT